MLLASAAPQIALDMQARADKHTAALAAAAVGSSGSSCIPGMGEVVRHPAAQILLPVQPGVRCHILAAAGGGGLPAVTVGDRVVNVQEVRMLARSHAQQPHCIQSLCLPVRLRAEIFLPSAAGAVQVGAVPFGLRGTVVGTEAGAADVIFDSPFAAGVTLGGRCAAGRGARVPADCLFNLSRAWAARARARTARNSAVAGTPRRALVILPHPRPKP